MHSSKIHRQQQIQVVIRLKPQVQQTAHISHFGKCVYTSPNQNNELIVQTPNKKEFFVFDNIADEHASQQDVYQSIGKQIIQSSTEGYNCCIFAYGQTGAGKTYSILGKATQLNNNIFAQSRGILPRLLDDLFQWAHNQTQKCSVLCSYMEIYNQQIFDLLNTEVKVRQIRQDIKKGVFVDNLSQQPVKTYEQGMEILMKGLKNRKIGETSMNKQSSRSHTIFTINLEFSVFDKQSQIQSKHQLRHRRAKINIVDLAGSERAKQTKVQGQRLKEGCNINKSLHVLGNVINALVQSTKKKKHIPFRDSKLTYFLKDSLGGNSVTKLLANIQPNKKFLSDTISTLMFAKRAKILRMKVQINEQISSQQNFQSLRVQIKKLREQLAEARFIKHNQSKLSMNQKGSLDQQSLQNPWIDASGFDTSKKDKIITVLQQNQVNYKALIQIYQQHLKMCTHGKHSNQQRINSKKAIDIHHQWKALQKKNQALVNLVKNFPAFTAIFKQNILLKNNSARPKNSFTKTQNNFKSTSNLKYLKASDIQSIQYLKQSGCFDEENKTSKLSHQVFQKIIKSYEALLQQVQQKMKEKLETLENLYEELLNQNKQKDDKIKQLKRKKQLSPQLQSLVNENEYLKLNVLQLQSEIGAMLQKQRTQRAQNRSNLNKSNQLDCQKDTNEDLEQKLDEKQVYRIVNNLENIRQQALQQIEAYQKQLDQAESIMTCFRMELSKYSDQNRKLAFENETFKLQIVQLKSKINELLKISSQGQIARDKEITNNTNTFWTNQQWSEDFINQLGTQGQNDHFVDKNKKNQTESEKESFSSTNAMRQQYKREIFEMKQQLKVYEGQRKDFSSELQNLKVRLTMIQRQFGKPLSDIIDSYRQKKRVKSPQIYHTVSMKSYYSPPMTQRMARQQVQIREKNNQNMSKKEENAVKKKIGQTKYPIIGKKQQKQHLAINWKVQKLQKQGSLTSRTKRQK